MCAIKSRDKKKPTLVFHLNLNFYETGSRNIIELDPISACLIKSF